MPNQEEKIRLVREQMRERIRVVIVWEDRNSRHQDIDRRAEYDLPNQEKYRLQEVAVLARHSRGLNDQQTRFEPLLEQIRQLEQAVQENAIQIFNMAEAMNEAGKDVQAGYMEQVAERFMEKHKDKCVLIAPKGWLPSLFSQQTRNSLNLTITLLG